MKKNLFLMLGLGAMLLTSCDQDIVNEIYLPGGGGSVVVTDSTSTKQLQVFTNLSETVQSLEFRDVLQFGLLLFRDFIVHQAHL